MKKSIIIAGASGLIGSRLSKTLIERGYSIISIGRDAGKNKILLPFITKAYSWVDVASGTAQEAFEKSECVVNLAGASIAGQRWTSAYKQIILDSRINATRHIVEAIAEAESPPALLNASAIGYYGDRGSIAITEESSAGADFLAEVCRKWEEEAMKAKSLTRVAIARIGIVLAREAGAFPRMAAPFRIFAGGSLGGGKQYMSWIHIDDLTEMLIRAIEDNLVEDAFNCVSPSPLTQKDFAIALGRALKKPAFLNVPAFILKALMGESSRMVLSSVKALPQKMQSIGFNFKFPTVELSIEDLLKK